MIRLLLFKNGKYDIYPIETCDSLPEMQLKFYKKIQDLLDSEDQLEFLKMEKQQIGIYRKKDEKPLSNSSLVFFKMLNLKENLLLSLTPVPGPLFEKDIKFIMKSMENINHDEFYY